MDLLAQLVRTEACEPLVGTLLQRMPTLRAPTVVRALEAPAGAGVFDRLMRSTPSLEVNDEVVELLLDPGASSKDVNSDAASSEMSTPWGWLVVDKDKWPLVGELMERHPRLRAAALAPSTILAAFEARQNQAVCLALIERLGTPLEPSFVRQIRECLPLLVVRDGYDDVIQALVLKEPGLAASVQQAQAAASDAASGDREASDDGEEEYDNEEQYGEEEYSDDDDGGGSLAMEEDPSDDDYE